MFIRKRLARQGKTLNTGRGWDETVARARFGGAMEFTDRQHEIVGIARRNGRVTVDGLSARFDVTPQTIRRDLNTLCRAGLLARVHGGATPASSVSNFGYEQRRLLASDGKRRIASRAAARIPNDVSVVLNIGTTTEEVARALYKHRDLVVVTNNINVVNILSGSPAKELILAGGVVRQSDGGVVGEAAIEMFRQFKVDYAVIGASAIDEEGAVLDFDYREVAVARAIIENAKTVILVADHTKFERSAPVRICDIAQIDAVVTDRAPPPRFAEACRAAGVELEIVARPQDETRSGTTAERAGGAHDARFG
jgi:DeoR family glycerol-3-phosphate regulon repressor